MMIKLNRNTIKKRQYVIFCMFIIFIIGIYVRIVYFQYFSSNKLSVMANSQYSYKEDITDANYMLFDSNGKQLLDYKKKYYVVICPDIFIKNNQDTDSDKILTLIYILRNYNNEYDLSKITNLSSSQKLYYEIDENTYNKLKNVKGVKGFYTYTYSSINRDGTWKIENLLTSTKKTDSNQLKSSNSLEMQIADKTKNNKKPQVIIDRDVNGNVTNEKTELPEKNMNVRLTVDKNIEDKIKETLNDDKYKNFSQIGVVLMEANTGNIKAMVQKNDNLPNINLGAATNHGFFPGSIFKVIVEEAGLDRKTLSLNDKFTCKGLYESEEPPHGTLNPAQALIESCNDIFFQIGNKVGFNNFYDNAKSQGLLEKSLGLDCEKEGNFEVKDPKYGDGSLGAASIGQGIRITPIEAINIVNTVINEGVYVKPKILDAYVDDNNNEIEKLNSNGHPVIEKSTANVLKDQMIEVIKQGTGKAAAVDNVEMGGKTGTTQRVEMSKSLAKSEEHSDGWFVGFFKFKGKYYSMVVFVKDIDKDKESGGITAAPVFKDVVSKLVSK
ncbi:peptidoglycan glycosyltransferase [Clostridium carboxidivorans P7]|uniref:Penicillin-binding protein transpeptidase n=1 Tax=Clostridium carboxidivorans P7 TaxID=536227 RepID=C6Q0X5_9CLOT|nr:penicillin-binding transpeptidase domain-containing protein [Clostridium carboxidivorans]AKN29384.1 peptidoglycan glycosyltransferase [Clostridium carboxidivorans P7]EET84847.1 penicillin-binding protein transpeptidase [Clostridium carboxidivorans P7]EFG89703.1 penicillin-binding protein, transpeptidase domain protein [Clostridium carboxidivorans P7]